MRNFLYVFLLIFFFSFSCKEEDPYKNYEWHSINVTATAYNSLSYQTDGDPHITAFGDSLYSGLRCIAVSRDLYRLGLKHDIPIKIEGFDSIYLVKDKMHPRWNKKIDIYMGLNVKAAREWGRRKVSISYGVPKPKVDK